MALTITPGHKPEVGWAQYHWVLCVAFPRRWSRPCFRWRFDPDTDATKYHSRCSSRAQLAFPRRRKHLVPPSSCLFYGILGYGPHHGPLCQLHHCRTGPYVHLFQFVSNGLSFMPCQELRTQFAQQIHYTQPGGITGHFMLLIMVLMYTTAHHKIRHQAFEVFWYTHHLAFFFMIGLFTHATGCFVRDSVNPAYVKTFPFYNTEFCLGYQSWRFTIWPAIIYFGERMYREYRARRATRLSRVLVHPSGMCLFFLLLHCLIAYRCHGTAHYQA